MKLKIRSDDASTQRTNDWHQMNDWLAELRNDDSAEPGAGPAVPAEAGSAEPAEAGPAEPAAAGPAVPPGPSRAVPPWEIGAVPPWASHVVPPWEIGTVPPWASRVAPPWESATLPPGAGRVAPPGAGREVPPGAGREVPPGAGRAAPAGAGAWPALRPVAAAEPAEPAERTEPAAPVRATERAVIGDQLRMPIMWCEMDSCISWHADPAALGEADTRARAISAGWRIDAFGRLACPQCLQRNPGFRTTQPVVLWDRYTAMARASRIAAVRSDRPVRIHPAVATMPA